VYDDDVVPTSSSSYYEEAIAPLMDLLSSFRDQIKERAGEGAAAIVQLCSNFDGLVVSLSKVLKPEVLPLLETVNKFNTQVKEKASLGPKELFKLCDELRDEELPNHGVVLEDRAKG